MLFYPTIPGLRPLAFSSVSWGVREFCTRARRVRGLGLPAPLPSPVFLPQQSFSAPSIFFGRFPSPTVVFLAHLPGSRTDCLLFFPGSPLAVSSFPLAAPFRGTNLPFYRKKPVPAHLPFPRAPLVSGLPSYFGRCRRLSMCIMFSIFPTPPLMGFSPVRAATSRISSR